VKLSVVVPALDEAAEIEAAVGGALAEGAEVLVVDGGSRDPTSRLAAQAGATVLHSSPGRARQLGVGAMNARGEVVLFLHADTRLPRGWATAVRDALADTAVVGGAFRFGFDRPGPLLRVVEWGTRLRVTLFRLPYGDQALFVRRSVLEAIGGVPQVPIMEDLDLVREMKGRGRIALLALPVTTSARRYRARGIARTVLRNAVASSAWALGLERARVAAWYQQ